MFVYDVLWESFSLKLYFLKTLASLVVSEKVNMTELVRHVLGAQKNNFLTPTRIKEQQTRNMAGITAIR